MTDKPTCSDIPWESEVGNHKKWYTTFKTQFSRQVLLEATV